MFFDIGAGEMIGLAVLGLILVGPERLPKLASDAARIVRKVQQFSQAATNELKENLGPGFEDLKPSDLNPKSFLKKQLAEVLDEKNDPSHITPVAPKIDPDVL